MVICCVCMYNCILIEHNNRIGVSVYIAMVTLMGAWRRPQEGSRHTCPESGTYHMKNNDDITHQIIYSSPPSLCRSKALAVL